MTALEIRGLRKTFDGREVLRGFDLSVRAGEFVALLGANGSGKSTALRCVAGLETPDAGTVSSAEASMVFQRIHLVGRRTALANVCGGALGRLSLHRSLVFPRSVRAEAMECLDRVGVADRASTVCARLSGGQQQRVAIARALCQRPQVILADEPVSALDPQAALQVLELLRDLASEGLAGVAVLHQPSLAHRFADRVVGLLHGRATADLDSLYEVT